MSFHMEIWAQNAEHARHAIQEAHLPGSVRIFLQQALEVPAPENSVVYVKAYGHLYDSPGSYAVSTATIEVKFVQLHQMPKREVPVDAL